MDADLPIAKDVFKRSNVQLTREALGRIRADKINFPDEEELEFRLEELRVPELSKVLVWVPFDDFAEVEPLGQGDVYRGTVLWSRGRHAKPQENGRGKFDIVYDIQGVGSTYALKEVSPLRAAEIMFSVHLTRIENVTMSVIGLSWIQATNKYFMVMEYGSMNIESYDILNMHSPEDFWRVVCDLIYHLSHSLNLIHQYGIVHRNLHPGNVVIQNGEPRIVDFKCATVIERTPQSAGVYGRLGYLPPEPFSGIRHDKASDVYCLGTMLWQIITGVPPCGIAGSREDGLREELIPGMPECLEIILTECWSPDPSKRPSAADVWSDMSMYRRDIVGHQMTCETLRFIEARRAGYRAEIATVGVAARKSRLYSRRQLERMAHTASAEAEESPPPPYVA